MLEDLFTPELMAKLSQVEQKLVADVISHEKEFQRPLPAKSFFKSLCLKLYRKALPQGKEEVRR
jgi:hypothetical protein